MVGSVGSDKAPVMGVSLAHVPTPGSEDHPDASRGSVRSFHGVRSVENRVGRRKRCCTPQLYQR